MKTLGKALLALFIAAPIAITMPLWNAYIARTFLGQPDGDGPGFVGIAMGVFLLPALASTAFFAMRPRGSRQTGLRISAAALMLVMAVNIGLLFQDKSEGPLEQPLDLGKATAEMQQIQREWPGVRFEYERSEKRITVRARKDSSAEGIVTISDIGFVDCRIVLPDQNRRYQHGTGVSSAKKLRAPVTEMLKAL